MEESDSATAFELLDKDYQETLQELSGKNAQIIDPFRVEYEKLFKALQKSHESEKRLIKKCRDLNNDITMNAQHVHTATKTTEEDAQKIAGLRKDIETQQKLVEHSTQKERQAKDSIDKFKADIKDLSRRIDQGASMSMEQESQLNQLGVEKEQLEKDRDMLQQNNEMLRNHAEQQRDEVREVEDRHAVSEDHIATVKQQLTEKIAEVEAEKKRKEKLEDDMKDLRLENEQHSEEMATHQRNIKVQEEELRKLDVEVQDAQKEESRLEAKVRQRMEEKTSFEAKLGQELAKNGKYVLDNSQREINIRQKRDDIAQQHGEKDTIIKMHDALRKKDRALEEERKTCESERNDLKSEHKSSQERLDTLKRDSTADRKKIEDLLRERDILNKNVIKADERTKKQIDLVKRQETQSMNLQKDIGRWKQDAQELKKRIHELEKQREKYGIELSQANAKYFAAVEELKTRDSRLTDLKKQIAEVNAKKSQQKNLYDAVCMDRNRYSKELVESNEQITEMKRKFRMMYLTTTALKEEIREKDRKLVECHFNTKKTHQNNEKLKDAKEKAQRRMKNLDNIVHTQRTEIKKLESTIQEAEQERQAQQKELEGVIGERDILGAQLIRRHEELALLYEKIKIQQSTLQKGESQYKERVEAIDDLRKQIHNTTSKVAVARSQVTNVDNLKREIHHLNRTLLREETKAKALQEELENPMNVHRWRELEGSDPATYEMIKKVKKLQKQLISKTEEVVEKDMVIQEKEKLYVQLKNIIARQPTAEVAEQLSWYSSNLKEKTLHMKQMVAELKQYHGQVKDFKDDIERYNKDFANTKQQYFGALRQRRGPSPET